MLAILKTFRSPSCLHCLKLPTLNSQYAEIRIHIHTHFIYMTVVPEAINMNDTWKYITLLLLKESVTFIRYSCILVENLRSII